MPPGAHVAYLSVEHVDQLQLLADSMVMAIDDHHVARDMTPDTELLRCNLLESIDRLAEARSRGPGQF